MTRQFHLLCRINAKLVNFCILGCYESQFDRQVQIS